ncbi:MAG TPA: RsiV family protein [Candidatus Paceibacterota bacterium]|jgi:hypothetical protein
MNNKHHAVWAVVALLIVFLAILVWRLFIDPTPRALAPGGTVATTTPTATTTPPIVLTDSGRYHDAEATYPSVTPLAQSAGAEADAGAVALMKSFVENAMGGFEERAEEQMPELASIAGGQKYALDIDYSLYESPKTISYVYIIYENTLGAHPNAYYRTFTFDRATGENIHLDELFAPGTSYLERLSARARAELPAIMAKRAETTPDQIDAEYINSGTQPMGDSFNNFAIDGTTLRLIFPPYQVGPYAYGTIEAPIPLSDLSSILNPKYRP